MHFTKAKQRKIQTGIHYRIPGRAKMASPTCQLALYSKTINPAASHCINQASIPLSLPSPSVPGPLLTHPKSAGCGSIQTYSRTKQKLADTQARLGQRDSYCFREGQAGVCQYELGRDLFYRPS